MDRNLLPTGSTNSDDSVNCDDLTIDGIRLDKLMTWRNSNVKAERAYYNSFKKWMNGSGNVPPPRYILVDSLPKDVPKERLVGIEPNPGPRNPVAGAILAASAVSQIAKVVRNIASTKKKKVVKTKTKSKSANLSLNDNRMGYVTAPSAVGTVFRPSSTSHTPFIVRGRSFAFEIQSSAANTPVLVTHTGSVTTLNNFAVDLMGDSTGQGNFWSFPDVLYNIGSSFTRYRFRKLDITYVPLVGTSVAGNVIFGTTPETSAINPVLTYGNIASIQNCTVCSVWGTTTLRAVAPGGLRNEWIYSDNSNPTTQAELRQECAGQFASTIAGSVASTKYGQFWYDYEIELDGIAPEVDFGVRNRTVSTPVAESSSDSSSSSLPSNTAAVEVHEPEYGIESLSDSIHIPRSMLPLLRRS